MPTHLLDRAVEGDHVAFKNLVRDAEEQLTRMGVSQESIEGLMGDARKLVSDSPFWRDDAPGLAYFASSLGSHAVRLASAVPQSVHVGTRHTITPLLPLLAATDTFFVLALSRNGARLYLADNLRLHELPLPGDMPRFQDFLDTLEMDRNTQFKASRVGQGGGRRSTNFGQGEGEENMKKYLLDYFRIVDNSVVQQIGKANRPLVLAGIDYLLPIYRQASRYRGIVNGGVAVNPSDLDRTQLHTMAWEIVNPMFKRKEHAALEQLAALAGTGRTSTSLDDVAVAASEGRVQNLFVAVNDGPSNGTGFDASTATLVNAAAVDTLATGGDIVAVSRGQIYDDAPMAAVFRF